MRLGELPKCDRLTIEAERRMADANHLHVRVDGPLYNYVKLSVQKRIHIRQ